MKPKSVCLVCGKPRPRRGFVPDGCECCDLTGVRVRQDLLRRLMGHAGRIREEPVVTINRALEAYLDMRERLVAAAERGEERGT